MAGERDGARQVYRVAELTRVIKTVLEAGVGWVWVEGELSNVRRPQSGHYYFTLKDEAAQLRGVLFRGNQQGLRGELQDGQKVRVYGQLTVYERSGDYQLIVRQLEDAGKGSLQAQFEALKARLQLEGLFDAARKRPLPLLPRHVGIVTSPTGAALRDILTVVGRRFPNLHIVVAPVRVQGDGAAAEIAAALDLLNARGGLDVVIVGRGGGSMEDLWCFNAEAVVRAVVRSRLPVISAVGHEIDFTLCDFAADMRAPTPSAAAELVVNRKDAFEQRLTELDRLQRRALCAHTQQARARLRVVAGSYVFREPANLVRRHQQALDSLALRMERELTAGLRQGEQRLSGLGLRLEQELRLSLQQGRGRLEDLALRTRHALRLRTERARQGLTGLERQLGALSPLAVLERGYSVTYGPDGRLIRSAGEVRAGWRLRTRVGDGSFDSTV